MKSKNNVLFILHLPPPVHGAAMVGQWIKNSNLINASFEADYLNLSTSTSLSDIRKGGLKKWTKLLKILWNLFKLLLKTNYGLCYVTLTATGPGFYKDTLVVFLLKIFRKKIVFHFHNKGVDQNSNSLLNRVLYKFVFRNTSSILLSEFLYPDIARYVKRDSVYFCPNGIKDIEYSFERSYSANPNEPCKLLFLSNMMEEKGVLVLLEASAILKKRKIDFECHFIGAWSDITKVFFEREIERLQITSLTFAHGKKYGDEKISFFENADIFVFPTYYHNETFGLVILEAMQAKLPVVSTFEGGIPSVVENGVTGILVEKRNATALADQLEILITNPSLQKQLGEAGRKRYEQLFTLEHFEKNLVHIIRDILKK